MVNIYRYNGGPSLPRKLISQGAFNKKFNVEVYPLSLKLRDSRDDSQSDLRLSKKVWKARYISSPVHIMFDVIFFLVSHYRIC